MFYFSSPDLIMMRFFQKLKTVPEMGQQTNSSQFIEEPEDIIAWLWSFAFWTVWSYQEPPVQTDCIYQQHMCTKDI